METVAADHAQDLPQPTKPSNERSTTTPPPRRSVQFSSDELGPIANGDTIEAVNDRSTSKERRGPNLFLKLRGFGPSSTIAQAPARAIGGLTSNGGSASRSPASQLSPRSDRHAPFLVGSVDDEESEQDADAEQSAGEESPSGSRYGRKSAKVRDTVDGGLQTALSTPRSPLARHGILSSSSFLSSDRFRPSLLDRRATTNDASEETRHGLSDGEGGGKYSKGSPWRRTGTWMNASRGLSQTHVRKTNPRSSGEERRPSNFRRFTGFGSVDSPDSTAFPPWRTHRGEGSGSVSAAKWRQLKAGIRMIGQRRKAENTVDHAKSAELLAELTAGVPAALILASMFQRDEHGNKRIPVLLEQLKVKITDSRQVDSKSGDRHLIFRIELEYGSGLTRMKWIIHRTLRDFANLHARYKVQNSTQKFKQLRGDDARAKMPHFPRSTFPYLRGIRGLESDSEDEGNSRDNTGPSGGEGSGNDHLAKKKKRPALRNARRKLSAIAIPGADGPNSSNAVHTLGRKDNYVERQRRKLETYLQQMIRYLIFRPESNRLCKFLELSALGVRLAAEGTYHGKEGLLILQSGKGVDFRKSLKPKLLKERHAPRWFCVRHSYIVCVDSPEAMNIYDVFLVDAGFRLQKDKPSFRHQRPRDIAKSARESATHPQHHSLRIENSERKLHLLARTERQLHQFEESIKYMSENTPWLQPNRFESFAPVRSGVFAQWLVDGRDYMWNVSRAISMAKDVIHIHDWWLSPELYMRRPAAISQKWRLDRLLQRKAREGVKIFVIVYRNIESAIPIDSEYTKFSLLDLHPNISVQRSPNQFRQNTFFWAHHEKICVVDYTVAFVGGIDLCFGRWDTPQHSVVDDKLTGFEISDEPKDADHCQLWAGKDYSNPRVQDFYALDKPYEEMYDRSKVPRMPWHDISMQVVGQPARDLARHFVQRWNFILRQRKPTRPTPFLLPPPDYNPADIEALGLNGTCEVQMLRSCSWWSIGTPVKTEHSIMTAYIKMIEQSDHFVYIENQFFISSCEIETTRIENQIGDALVERIIRASQKGEDWRAVIVIPLMPGFQNTVDSADGTSIRLIMQCQFRSICRGDSSIFGRLRANGIEPEDHIHFYALRSWGVLGTSRTLVTEQLYIHAKCMIVDDRIAIIGSANINERSMLGSRDSECAAVVRDTDMLWSTMAGEPYLVGRFPHTLRMRLMREHIGIDVDEAMEEDRQEIDPDDVDVNQKTAGDNTAESGSSIDLAAAEELAQKLLSKSEIQDELLQKNEQIHSYNHDAQWSQMGSPHIMSNKRPTRDARVTANPKHREDVAGEGADKMSLNQQASRGRDTGPAKADGEILISPSAAGASQAMMPTPIGHQTPESSPAPDDIERGEPQLPPEPLTRTKTADLDLPNWSQLPALPSTDDTDIGGPVKEAQRTPSQKAAQPRHPLVADMKRPIVTKDCIRDPLSESFYLDTWHAVAENNTRLFRHVFRCMPDNEVKSWKEYKEYMAYSVRFTESQGGKSSKDGKPAVSDLPQAPNSSGPPGQGTTVSEKLRTFGPTGGKSNASEQGKLQLLNEKLTSLLPTKEEDSEKPTGKFEEWAEEAKRTRAERIEREEKRQQADSMDEKTHTTDPMTEAALKEFAPLKPSTTFDESSLQKQQRRSQSPSQKAGNNNNNTSTTTRRRRATTRGSRREFHASDEVVSRKEAEELMSMVQGHLVVWPYDWLVKEEQGGNWLYTVDGLAPLEIYN